MSPGTVLGDRYRLEDLLSEHDGARFWRAIDVVLARSVAVHVLASDDPRADAVLAAARNSARVTDPHFLRVLDADDADGLTWVINEWGDGDSLDLMLEQGPLPPSRAAWLAREVAEAMEAAHTVGIAHGRLNPEAVLVTRAGAVKVIGFSVYAAIAGTADRDDTFGAMSDVDADVVDLAGILYAALTARWPGVSASSVPRAPREGRRTLRPRQVRAGVPRTLDAICDRVLNKQASLHDAPLSTAFEVAAALSDHVGDPARSAPVDLPAMHIDPDAGSAEDTATGALAPVEAPAETPVGAPEPAAAPAPVSQDEPDTESEPDNESEPEPGVPPAAPAVTAPRPPTAARPASVPLPAAEPDATMPHAFADLDPHELAGGSDWERAAPPPPFEQPAERPLFAEQERRVPPGAAPTPAAPEPPPGWPFDDPDAEYAEGTAPSRWRRRVVILVLLALLAAAMYVAFSLGRGDDPEADPAPGSPTATPTEVVPSGTPLRIFNASDFDPEGDPPEENPGQVGRAIDGDPETAWRTQVYRGNPRLGGLKSGVGLVLDLGSQRSVGSVELNLVGAPTSYEIWAAPSGVNDAPVELADVRRLTGQNATGTVSVARFESPVRTRFLLVWITSLPEAPGGYRAEISEVVPRP